jgi:uncharacterized repeat protein (TIGR01451 family)
MRAFKSDLWSGLASRAALAMLGIIILGAPARAQTISSAANQLFHVNDAATTISPITVADPAGGVIKFNRDIRINIPAGFNMTWDTSVLTATLTGSGASKCTPAVTYTNGNLTVNINVTATFAAGDQVVISGLRFTNFTATSAVNNLQLDLKNNPGFNASDTRTIQIGPYNNVALTPASTTLSSLPTNGGNLTASFTLTNSGAVSDSYDLLTSKNPGTALTVVSITGTTITQGANPDSARRAALVNAGTVTVTVTYKIGNVANGTIDTLKLTGRSVGNPAKTSAGVLIVTVIRPVIAVAKGVSPPGSPLPGANLTFTSTVTNTGSANASSLALIDSIPSWVEFKTSSASTTLPAGVSALVDYSNDGGLTWTYVPASGACSAPAGFDRCVNRIRWRLQAVLSSVAPNNQGTLQFMSRIR